MGYVFYTKPAAKPISYSEHFRSLNDILYIVIHATGNKTDTAKANATYYATSNTRRAGAHFFVDDISVYQSIAPTKVAFAVGGEKYDDCKNTGGGKLHRKCNNANSISIELCSTDGKISEKTLENAVMLTCDLMKKYHVASNRVIMHFDVTGKHCPYWDGWWNKNHKEWYKFKKKVMEYGKV